MRNKNESNVNKNVGMGNEQSRRTGSEGYGSSPGRESNISREDKSPGRGSLDRSDSRDERHDKE